MQVPIPCILELAVNTIAVWIVEAMMTKGATIIVAGRAYRAHARACLVAMDGDLSGCEFCAVVPVTFISPFALAS